MKTLLGTLASLVVATVLLPMAPPASAAGAQGTSGTVTVPASRTLAVVGHGYGHGHGMSQYGAQGAALRGLSAARILGFYYPGTTAGRMTGRVRVLISADTDHSTTVLPRSGLRVRDLARSVNHPLPVLSGVRQWRLSAAGAGTRVSYLRQGTWHTLAVGGRSALPGSAEFWSTTGPLTLVTPSGTAAYRGRLRSVAPSAGSRSRITVNVVGMDNYLKGVVASEMPASWRPAAVQAQAVAARTYAFWSRAQRLDGAYQICDTTACQVYHGYAAEDPRSSAAVDRTTGQVRLYGSRPAFTQFSASSGGWLSSGGTPYLVAKADPYDGFSGNPVHSWSTRVRVSTLERAYPRVGRLTSVRVVSRDGHGDLGGRVGALQLRGTRGSASMRGDAFRSLFGLRSSWFALRAR